MKTYFALSVFALVAIVGTSFANAALTINANFLAKSTFSITGSVSKGAGTWVIDHPLDPTNKLLYHSFVESPEAMNQYNGTATLDTNGEVVVQLPGYFEALNKDFTYQFFPLRAAMPNLHIKKKIMNNMFTIAGGTPGGEISWMVTGVRHDPYIRAHPIVPEVEKGPSQIVDKGKCIFEPLCK
jgi:hypothetical protein